MDNLELERLIKQHMKEAKKFMRKMKQNIKSSKEDYRSNKILLRKKWKNMVVIRNKQRLDLLYT